MGQESGPVEVREGGEVVVTYKGKDLEIVCVYCVYKALGHMDISDIVRNHARYVIGHAAVFQDGDYA